MRTSHIIAAAVFATFGTVAAPALADTNKGAETVVFELDLTAPDTELYTAISDQAWS